LIPVRDELGFGDASDPRLDRWQTWALRAAAAGLVPSLLAVGVWPERFAASYLVAFLFWVGLALGCLGFTMLHHLVGGEWGLPIRRPMEAGAMTLIPLAVMFLPVIFNLRVLYPWARSSTARFGVELNYRSSYLNGSFFVLRAALYFCIWIGLATLLYRGSRAQDREPDPSLRQRLEQLSGPGLAILFLSNSFAVIDWGMSRDEGWFSTIYPAMLITGEALSTLAFMIVLAVLLSSVHSTAEALSPPRLHDLGNLLLAFVMLWAYLSFSQFLIIWSGNLPEETRWYLRRTNGGWQWIALILIGLHFFLPFFFLLFRTTKRESWFLLRVAALILILHLVDVIWLVLPASTNSAQTRIPWEAMPVMLTATPGIGGVWVVTFLWCLKRAFRGPAHGVQARTPLDESGGESSC
jgi:hypothetical protein